MYAVFSEVNAEDSHKEAGREMLNRIAVPAPRPRAPRVPTGSSRRTGGASPSWSSRRKPKPAALADRFEVGQPPDPAAPEGITFRTVEVQEVIASV